LIWLSVEKREFEKSPSPLSQFAPAGFTLAGNHAPGETLRDADASATTVAPRSTATTARSGNLRIQPIPPLDSALRTARRASLLDAAIIVGAAGSHKGVGRPRARQ